MADTISGPDAAQMQHLLPGWVDPCRLTSLIALRREFHRLPEPGWAEFVTTARIAKRFADLGYKITFGGEFISPEFVRGRDPSEAARGKVRALSEGISQDLLERMGEYPGLIAEWDTGRPGRTVAIRFELDGLLVEEPSSADHFPAKEGFASVIHGVMHACGHDGHMAVACGLARFIASNTEEIAGKIIFIFQPAEEGSRGAYPIMKSRLLDKVDFILCAHLGVDVELGVVVAAPEKFLCTTKIDFEFVGQPSHAGQQPQLGRNALLAAANAAMNVMALPRHADGMTRVNVGTLHAGEGRNVVPSRATMEVEVRGENEAINRDLTSEAFQRCEGAAMSFGVECHRHIVGEAIDFVPDESVAQMITVCARRARFCRKVVPTLPYNGSDDGTLLMRYVQEHGGKAGYFMVGASRGMMGAKSAIDFDEHALATMYDTYAHLLTALMGKWRSK